MSIALTFCLNISLHILNFSIEKTAVLCYRVILEDHSFTYSKFSLPKCQVLPSVLIKILSKFLVCLLMRFLVTLWYRLSSSLYVQSHSVS